MAQTMETKRGEAENGSITQRAKAFVTTEARNLAERQGVNEKVAERIDTYQEALGGLRQNMSRRGSGRGIAYVEDLAARVEEVGDCVRAGDYAGAGRAVREFAEEHPEVFVGIAFAAGAFVGRVLREAVVRESRQNETTMGGDGAGLQQTRPMVSAGGSYTGPSQGV